jgi:hypothetical protein
MAEYARLAPGSSALQAHFFKNADLGDRIGATISLQDQNDSVAARG